MKSREPSAPIESTDVDPIVVEVRARFVADFPMRCDAASSLVDRTADEQQRPQAARSLRSLAHRMAGLAGLVGFPRVSEQAARLEDVAAKLATGELEPPSAHSVVASIRAAFADELAGSDASRSETPVATDRGCVLVAEDDDEQRSILVEQLSRAGYRTQDVPTGDAVIAAARAVHPSIVLLDIEMPGLDGYAVCRALKADADLASVPVVFMTTRARVDDRLAGLTLGADDYLIKPVDARELILRLERVIRRAARPGEVAPDGVVPYEEFLRIAARDLARRPASLVMMRIPADRMDQAVAKIRHEIRRADAASMLDRSSLLLLLPELTGSPVRARAAELIARLADLGIPDVAAGVTCSTSPGSKPVAAMLGEADRALVEARYNGNAVTVHGDALPRVVPAVQRTALIADDDPDVIRIVDVQLRGAGYDTRLAFDGADALTALETMQPDVIVLDLMMPKVGGFDVLRSINSREGSRPKVIVLSARGREEDVTRAFDLGADDYVVKPFKPQELLARVARLVR